MAMIFPQPPYTVISGSKKLVPALGIASAHHVPSCPIYLCGFPTLFPVPNKVRFSHRHTVFLHYCSRPFPWVLGHGSKKFYTLLLPPLTTTHIGGETVECG